MQVERSSKIPSPAPHYETDAVEEIEDDAGVIQPTAKSAPRQGVSVSDDDEAEDELDELQESSQESKSTIESWTD